MNERLIRHTIRGKRNFLQRGKTVHGEWKNTPRRKRQIQTAEVIDDRARKGGLCLLIVPNTGKRSSSRGGHSQAPSFPSSAPPLPVPLAVFIQLKGEAHTLFAKKQGRDVVQVAVGVVLEPPVSRQH